MGIENYCIRFDSTEARKKNPELGSTRYAFIIGALDRVRKQHFKAGKLDLVRFHAFLRSIYPYNKTFAEMKSALLEIAPLLNIIDCLGLSRSEAGDLKMLKKCIEGGMTMQDFDDAEIPQEHIEEDDYVIRTKYGEILPAFYRFDKKLTDHERNMARAAYAYKYAESEKKKWSTYLKSSIATVGHIRKHGKSFDWTNDPNDYNEKVYK